MLLQNYGVNNYVWVSQMLSFIVGIIFVRCEVEILTSLTLFRFNKINNIKQTSQLNQSSTAYLLKQLFNQIDEKFKNAEKNAEKYKELYKKAYGVVEKHKERELQYRAAINDLENKLQQRIMQQPIQRVYSQYPDSRMNMQSYAPVPVPIRDDLDFDDLTHLK
ncbi:Hypothetical_protein [Hexamita inflata]|uniref:Hypothetical_protein n=1 Tax=Hexamita inflata TaxID=28002 RepID=A0AA86R7N1_9EUKA|nr:Hypothetical protein HINF_LOCUS60561 [Hexamita inflata]